MGYAHINNLYKNQDILMFKEVYALEKIHGTSAHLRWNAEKKKLSFYSGGENHDKFVALFNIPLLEEKLSEMFITSNAIIYGEAYGGKQQGMSSTYGKELKFIGFDVQVNNMWVSVPNAESICKALNIEFVDYVKISTNIELINAERDKDSTQAIRNGCGEGKMREGVVLKPLIELTTNNGERIMAKHRRAEFNETKTYREVSPEELKVLKDAQAIAEEWCVEMRLKHVLDKLPQNINVESTKLVIDSMIEDIYREGKGEIVESKEVAKAIGSKTSKMFKQFIENKLQNHG